jgi:hypothetical protein
LHVAFISIRKSGLDNTPFGVPAEVEAKPGAGELLVMLAVEPVVGPVGELVTELVAEPEVAGAAERADEPPQPARTRPGNASAAASHPAVVVMQVSYGVGAADAGHGESPP